MSSPQSEVGSDELGERSSHASYTEGEDELRDMRDIRPRDFWDEHNAKQRLARFDAGRNGPAGPAQARVPLSTVPSLSPTRGPVGPGAGAGA